MTESNTSAYGRARERLDAHIGVGLAEARRAIQNDPMANALYQVAVRAIAELEEAIEGKIVVPINRPIDPTATVRFVTNAGDESPWVADRFKREYGL